MTAIGGPGCSAPVQIAVAIVERDGCYLVGRRPEGVPLAGLWEFPGGKILTGETAEQAAARECLEETGLLVEVLAAYAVVDHHYEHAQVRLNFFTCRPLEPLREPIPPFAWQPASTLAELSFPAANEAILRQLLARP